ncbi:MAG: 23S rRNA (adenine(2503)-C(2))-methyltransferase RlmN [Lachnospiraceae bacterium]|nr:23S rRNA (adenine(2503)-C(2))-methyltransferase RlmN [Lachnospiraceae bacterium]
METGKKDIKSYTLQELSEELLTMGEKKFRAAQIFDWLHKSQVTDFSRMTNLPETLRKRLAEVYTLVVLREVKRLSSAQDETVKFLFALPDDKVIESVFMKYKHGNSVCISSQAGCRMGCRFCASTLGGLERNLLPSEMLEQIYRIQELTGERVSNVVVMGTGEPMDNYGNLVRFLRLITDAKGQGMSIRNITVSTCGLVEPMRRFAEEGLPVTLALSLHAPNDEARRRLMPVANRYSLEEVIAACDNYFEKTGRRITYEYSLVAGENDTGADADELGKLLYKKNCHVNLIPVNPIKERDYRQSSFKNVLNFRKTLEKYNINVTIRRELGADIGAACGQLRKSHLDSDFPAKNSCGTGCEQY